MTGIKREYGDCPLCLEGEKRGFAVYHLKDGSVVVGCKGKENGSCGQQRCFLPGMMILADAERAALEDAGIKR